MGKVQKKNKKENETSIKNDDGLSFDVQKENTEIEDREESLTKLLSEEKQTQTQSDSEEQSQVDPQEASLPEQVEAEAGKGKKSKKQKKELSFEERYDPENFMPKSLREQMEGYKNLNDYDKQAITRGNKIKYRGPLSYRSFKMLAMLIIILPFILFRIILDSPSLTESGFMETVFDVLIFLDDITLPLFLLAAFCFVLNRPREVKSRLIIYLLFAVAIYSGIIIAFYRYVIPLVEMLHPEWLETANIYAYANRETLATLGSLINYNVFIDLFLCTLFFFFIYYKPKKLQKKGLIAFRLCALIPVIYVIVSVIVYGLFASGQIELAIWQFALLTCRTPASYIVFFALALFLGFRKNQYLKQGTAYGYSLYVKTNANSLQFSIYCSAVIAVVSLVDFLLSLIPGTDLWLMGNSYNMVFIIPFVMLLSYNRTYKNPTIDTLLPLVFICALIFFTLDIAYAAFIMFGKN